MKKILTIIGARPQIIKAAALSRAIRGSFADQFQEVIVHTGQHYDANMSEQFFAELEIPAPDYNLRAGSGKHGEQTARMIAGIEGILEKEQPDYLILYGDTNSTLAGAVAASKMQVPIVHIEAGLRSFNKAMPEEINRILSDHVSTYLFPPTVAGMENLVKEGFGIKTEPPYSMDKPGVFNVGDVMYDNSTYFSMIADRQVNLKDAYGLESGKYVLATLHRNTNTDDPIRLQAILEAFQEISHRYEVEVVIPLHPRTRKQLEALLEVSFRQALEDNTRLRFLPPVSFLEMIALEKGATVVMTDSGGVQKEAFFFGKPCLILRAETEWVEIVTSGAALLCDADKELIVASFQAIVAQPPTDFPLLYGNGDAAGQILQILLGEGRELTH
ncbi:UDP-N-acetylglucosamine 2-epimerase (non-hydrolyzing) [Rhabdobacter roseus]|uniref:UDP-GlcNAc3NAcA epimerase n=1 Tax=Rhabdobacter roseus TaxID=1655419 RepID=A0A840TJY6_9BACT|nr:UDP-GlcNAc3NAcA epimerase [Rhabdobacter roseus]